MSYPIEEPRDLREKILSEIHFTEDDPFEGYAFRATEIPGVQESTQDTEWFQLIANRIKQIGFDRRFGTYVIDAPNCPCGIALAGFVRDR